MLNTYKDERGYMSSIYRAADDPYNIKWIEDRVSVSRCGVIRGFHSDNCTWKLCTCVFGELDLVTYNIDTGKRVKVTMTPDNHQQILVPPRVFNAHQCISETCMLHYKWSEPYNLAGQWSIYYDDEDIAPDWQEIPEIVASRDLLSPSLKSFLLEGKHAV